MKTVRLNFENGINVVGDKAIIAEGFATILDNVDLRSGTMKPFKAPEYQFAVGANNTRAWSYRGRWFQSDNWRDYVGEFIGGTERVYWTEEGKRPKKSIDGNIDYLGTPRPISSLLVNQTSSLSPGAFTATTLYDGSGNLSDGDRYYRVATITKDGILPAAAAIKASVSDTTHKGASVKLTWTGVTGATGYVVYEGDTAAQQRLSVLNAGQLSYLDTGAVTASGDNAGQYDQLQQFTYSYTYKRRVGSYIDESGLAPISIPATGSAGRFISRDMMTDGYWNTTDATNTSSSVDPLLVQTFASGSIAISPSVVVLTGVTPLYDAVLQQTKFHLVAHGFLTGDKVKFVMSDPLWNNQVYPIVKIDADNFAVQEVKAPSDTMPLTSAASCQSVKSTVTYSPATGGKVVSAPDSSGNPTYDVVYIKSSSGDVVDDLFKATYIDSTHFSIQRITISTTAFNTTLSKWIPGNAHYYKWCIYRNEQGGWFLVDEVDMWEQTYVDAKPFSALGSPPSSYYLENGITVDYDISNIGMSNVESHYGMLFAIDGHNVRWTPQLQADAWPDVFSVTLPYQPVALASFSQGLIILCQDAIYRLDGNIPTGMSLAKTMAEDGCYAPHSVQKTDKGLIYLGKRGIMCFNGTSAFCLTDTRVLGTTLNSPSRLVSAYPFWWMPTLMTKNYSDLAGEDGIRGDIYVFNMDNTQPIEGYNKNIKSFYHIGKYYLFYTGVDYPGNTAFFIDMQLPGFPICTLGMKAIDAHVDELENAFVLFDNSPTTDAIFNGFYAAEATMVAYAPSTASGRAVSKFASKNSRIPMHVKTGNQAYGSPTERKRWQQVEFHGKGTLSVRVYVDGVWIADADVTLTETPAKDRRMGLPTGTRGYLMDLEFSGDADVRAVETSFTQMNSPS